MGRLDSWSLGEKQGWERLGSHVPRWISDGLLGFLEGRGIKVWTFPRGHRSKVRGPTA